MLLLASLLLSTAALPVEPGPAGEAASSVTALLGVELDKAMIRYGKAADFDPERGDRVGTVRSRAVYEEIPAWKTIQKEKIQPGTARYTQLMKQATATFKRVLRKVADADGYVLIVEDGGISGYPTTDLTQATIDAI